MLGLTKPEKKILVAVLSILMVLCTMAYLAHRNSQRLIAASEMIEQSEEIKYHITEVLSSSADLETGVRGYVITGNEEYLEPTIQAMAGVFVHLEQLNSSAGITENQKKQTDRLRKLAQQKITITNRTIELRRQKGMADASALITKGEGLALMNEIRSITDDMIREEDTRLQKLKAESKESISGFAFAFYLLLLKIAITVGSVVFLLAFYFRNRRKAEKELSESKELFQNVLDHTSSPISIKDLSGRFILINKAYESLFFVNKNHITEKTVHDLFPKKVADDIRHSDLEVIKHQKQLMIEESMPRLGETRHFTSLKFPLFDANKIPYAICSISTDDTDKLKTEKQHREQMARILDLFNNAPCGYQAANVDGIIIEMNDTLLRWLGYTREEVIGKMHIRNFVSHESMEQYAYYYPRLRTGELRSIFDVEGAYVKKDGSKLPIVMNSIIQTDENGKFLYSRTSIFDISYRKQLEEMVGNN